MKKIFQKTVFFLVLMQSTIVFAQTQKTLTVVLDWFINPNHAPLLVAEREGFFAKRGLKIKFITPADVAEGTKMVMAKRADIALTYQPTLVYYAALGLPIIRFATLIDQPLNCLVVLDDGRIRSLKDLAGKSIGSSASEIDNIIFSTMLEFVNLSLKDVQITNIGFNLVSALLTKKIDGFTGGMRNFEPLAIELAGKTSRVFYPEQHGFPNYEELIFITNKSRVHDPALIGFVQALREGVLYLRKNPLTSWQKVVEFHPQMNNALNQKAWFVTLTYFARDPAKLNRKCYEKLAQFMWQKKLIRKLTKIEDYAIELK